jgi:hypothetical protein
MIEHALVVRRNWIAGGCFLGGKVSGILGFVLSCAHHFYAALTLWSIGLTLIVISVAICIRVLYSPEYRAICPEEN